MLRKTRARVAAAVGMSDKPLEKVRAVTAASEAEPEVFGDLPERVAQRR